MAEVQGEPRSYLTIPIVAGLGNQLFMVAAGFAMQEFVPGVKLIFLVHHNPKERSPYWVSFFADCPEVQNILVKELPKTKWEQLGDHKTCFTFINYLGSIRRNFRREISTSIYGFFQNTRYLPERSLVLRIFNIEQKQKILRERFPEVDFNTICSVHFRLGDYQAKPWMYPLLPDDYYKRAIAKIRSLKPNVNKLLIFNEPADQETVQGRLSLISQDTGYELQYATLFKITDWEEMIMMSLCSANIMANSTFSWWGSYLNCNPEAAIICPKTWTNIGDEDQRNLSQISWVLI